MKVGFWDSVDHLMDDLIVLKNCSEACTAMGLSLLNLYVKIVSKNKTIVTQRRSNDTVSIIKSMIECTEDIKQNQQILMYKGTPLRDHKQLATYKIDDWSIIYVLVGPPLFRPTVVDDDGLMITLKMPNWNTAVIDVKSWFTVKDIKTVIESSSGLPLEKATLSHGGKVLEDAMTIEDCGVDLGTPFYVNYLCPKGEFQIVVCDFNGWKKSVAASASHTVSDIKKKIEDICGVHPSRQILFHGKNTPRLDNEKTLGFYGIKENSVVWLLGPSLKLYIKMPQVGTVLQLKVYSHYTIKNIKDMIFVEMGIPCNGQTLVYTGMSLQNSMTLEHYKIRRNSTIYAIIGIDEDEDGDEELDLFISIMPQVRTTSIKVKTWYTISDVKAVIESISEIPICVQSLIYNQESLEDWRNIAHCKIFQEYPLIMEIQHLPVQIYINTCNKKGENETMVVEVDSSQDVDDVMKLIPKEKKENINGKPCLFFDEISLMAPYKMLAQYGIGSGSIVSLDRAVQINVTDLHGTLSKVYLKPSYSIGKVKTKVEEGCGIPSELQMLTYKENELDDRLILGDCEAMLGSLWDLRWNCYGSAWSFFWPSYNASSNNMDNNKCLKKIMDSKVYI